MKAACRFLLSHVADPAATGARRLASLRPAEALPLDEVEIALYKEDL